MKKVLLIIVCLFMCLGFIGCSGKDNNNVPTPENEPETTVPDGNEGNNNQEPVVEPVEEPEVLITDGPIFLKHDSQSDNEKWTMYMYSLKTGEKYDVFTFNQQTYIANFGHSLSLTMSVWGDDKFLKEQLFDSTYQRLACSWVNKSDNSNHVGWIDAFGDLTDVTEIVHPAGSGFSSVAPKDEKAMFTSDDKLVFYDRNEDVWCYFDEKTQSIVEKYKRNKENDPYWNEDFVGLDYQNRPSGNYMLINGDYYSLNYIVERTRKGSTAYDYAVLPDGVSVFTVQQHAIRHYGKGITDKRNSVYYSENAVTITPKTEYAIENMVYANGKIAFVATRGSQRALFVMPYENRTAGEPELVTELGDKWSPSGILFGWAE
ncbi:MAG: hypothetical protein IIY51_06485 [Erysipelotrichaceae bacterium]|nr:hypothetical protein [Erysipelotrichaceae bacterium]